MTHEQVMREALSRIEELQARLREAEAPRREPIAIVGLGCRFPGAAGPEAYWRLLRDGVDAVTEIPRSRWDIDACYDPDPDAAGKMYTRSGGFLDDIEDFDAGFFGISPREAVSLDPQQRLLLEACWEALEHAGIPADSLAGSASGVFMGIGGVDYYQRLATREPGAVDAYMASGNAHSIASGRLSYLLGLQGPSLSVDTACSSSLVAIHLACRSLRDRECDLALTGGVSVILSPAIHFNHCRSRMLAPDGRCKAFDAAADGFIRSEGCGIVVLKRLADAERDGDRVLAVIRGSAVNQDGRTSALTVPNGPAQQAVIRRALADAGVDPARVSYVEAHGTGTSLGDPIEASALGAVFATRQEPLSIGSVKTNIGHAEAAAGVAGLIKVVLAMRHRELPPQLHFREPNPRIEWNRLPLRVVTEPTPWGTADEPLFAGVSSFGFGGTNAHLVLESASSRDGDRPAPRSARSLLVLSARTPAALQALAAAHRSALGGARDADAWGAVCADAALGRMQMPVRAAVAADTSAAACEALDAVASGRHAPNVWTGEAVPDADGRIAFVYPGQGALRWGMGRALYEAHTVYRAAIDRCAAVLADEWSVPLTEILYGARGETLIERTEFAQAALLATEYAWTAVWESLGVRPAAVIGHSVGEFAAACAAGVLEVEDACRLLAARGRLMQPLGGRMAVIGAAEARVRDLLTSHPGVVIAAINGPAQVVVSGEANRVRDAMAEAKDAGLTTHALTGDVAFHSPLMEPMLPAWRDEVSRARFAAPRCEWVSTVTGRDAADEVTEPEYWVTQVRQPVLYAQAATRLWESGARIWLETGPSAGLAALAGEVAGPSAGSGVWIAGLRARQDDRVLLRAQVAQAYVAGVRMTWSGWFGPRRMQTTLPTYPFERRRYWIEAASVAAAPPAALEYETRWEAATAEAGAPSGVWVVTGGGEAITRAVSGMLQRRGARVVSSLSHDVAGVLYLGGLDLPAAEASPSAAALEAGAVSSCMGLAALLRDAAATAPRARVWAVTRGAVAVNPAETAAVAQAPLWGVGKVAALEYPEAWGGLLDLDPGGERLDGIECVFGVGGEDQLAVRNGRVHVPRLHAAAVPGARATCAADATYLITGGRGALGLEVAGRLADRGARHLVLLGRRAPDEAARDRIARLERQGVTVRLEQADVTDAGDMRRLVDRLASGMPPLRGVVHAAGSNGHHPLADLDAATFRDVARAKISGAWLLHELTREMPLDFFVCFSSIASVWGSKGQAHYAAANAALDALVSRRIHEGLPATSLNWGPWTAGGGMATADAQEWLARVGVRPMTPAAALDVFESRLGSSGHAVVADIDWPRFLEVYQSRRTSPFFRLVAPEAARGDAAAPPARRDAGLADTIRAKGAVEGRRALAQFVRERVSQVMNLDPRNAPAPHQGFFSIGFDSLMALELKNRLAADLDAPLPSTLAFDYPNIGDLAEYLARDILRLDAAVDAAADAAPARAGAAPAAVAAGDAAGAVPADVQASIDATLDRIGRLMGKR